MTQISLNALRQLRTRASDLLDRLPGDLRPFQHEDKLTFLRTPDSKPITGDVNVTTTCSCVMALALTHGFSKFYDGGTKAAKAILGRLVAAPWMSSGLILNNAFTTTLVLRTYGVLKGTGVIAADDPEPSKNWDLSLAVDNEKAALGLAKKLDPNSEDPACRFLYLSVSDTTRVLLKEIEANHQKLARALTSDLRRVLQSGWIYEEGRFKKGRPAQVRATIENITGYKVVELNYELLSDQFPEQVQPPPSRTLGEIARQLASHPKNFAINDYPTSPAIVYWFVDGVARANIALLPADWTRLCEWARDEFSRQHSLVLAERDSLMDPISMAMAACLCSRLRSLGAAERIGLTSDHIASLPSDIELEHAIRTLFRHQSKSGIWAKYFPMFHYQDQGAGSNFCFAFELLEAILNEFAGEKNHLLEEREFIQGLEKAVTWCEANRLDFKAQKSHSGWNSGGYITTLKKDQPESWATAVVHMFLYELKTVLSEHIQRRILARYRTQPAPARVSDSTLNEMLDIELEIPGERTNLKAALKRYLVEPHRGRTEQELRYGRPMKPTSALLFGPPGTSKTNVTKAVAAALGWPLVTITPSEFVKGSLAQVYVQADEIFRDVMDLSGVVVFFDEMDALMQSRERGELDTATQFLTTAMLPKLVDLHDQGRAIFFMATNYQANFDPAIKRAGRFDLLLCMGPPTLAEKLGHLSAFFRDKVLKQEQADKARRLFEEYLSGDAALRDQLELYTYADFQTFLKRIGNESNLGDALEKLAQEGLKRLIEDHSKYVVLRLADLPDDVRQKMWSWTDFESADAEKRILKKEIGRYLRDRKESRIQYSD